MSFWSCTSCSKSFTRKGDLTRHELLHTGIKPHVCETCGKGFAQYSGLKTHRNVHSKAKPYICGIKNCTKAFGDPSSRARHRKETHNREVAYQCIITDCGTRIKRRSAFMAHLRKHGLDPNSLCLRTTVLRSSEGGSPAASPAAESASQYSMQPRSVSPSFHSDSSGHYPSVNSGDTSCFIDDWPGAYPTDRHWANLDPANNTLLPTLGQTMDGFPHDLCPYVPNLEDPFYFDSIFHTVISHPLLTASPLNLPAPGPYLETGVNASQSTLSSPSSPYSTLCIPDFSDDILSLVGNASQESLLYDLI